MAGVPERTIWASFEQRAKPDHRPNLRTFYPEKREIDMTPDEKAAADKWIDDHFRFLVPDDDTEASLDWLLDTLGAAVARFDQVMADAARSPVAYALSDDTRHNICDEALGRVAPCDMRAGGEITDGT